ncbi:exported hypothetical protein [Frankia sp. AiPs1]
MLLAAMTRSARLPPSGRFAAMGGLHAGPVAALAGAPVLVRPGDPVRPAGRFWSATGRALPAGACTIRAHERGSHAKFNRRVPPIYR